MSFNLILLLWLLFVMFPILLKRLKYDSNNNWPDANTLLEYIFNKIPKVKPELEYTFFRLLLILAVFLLYLSLKLEDSQDYSDTSWPLVVHILCLLTFTYMGYLMSDELFDTFWNFTISLFSFFFIFTLFSGIINFIFIETDWTII